MKKGDVMTHLGHEREVQVVNTYPGFTDVYFTMHCKCHNVDHGERSIRINQEAGR